MQRKNIICFAAGHSGGHIMPCLSIANQFNNCRINFITTNKKLDSDILKNKNINKHLKLNLDKIPDNFFSIPIFLIKLFFAFIKSSVFLLCNRPDKLITTGGLVAIPPFLAAKILGINLEIYELNVEPGKATKFLSKICKNIKICFEETEKYFNKKPARRSTSQYYPGQTFDFTPGEDGCTLVNYPVRFTDKDKIFNRNEILQKLNFNSDKKTILVIGGSQGSIFLNNIVKEFVIKYKPINIQIIHQTGINEDYKNWQNFYKQYEIKNIIFSFNENVKDFYLASDLILCRSGAGTLAEIIFFEKLCITIPLQTATTNHQILNANALARKHPNIVKTIAQPSPEATADVAQNDVQRIIDSAHKYLNG